MRRSVFSFVFVETKLRADQCSRFSHEIFRPAGDEQFGSGINSIDRESVNPGYTPDYIQALDFSRRNTGLQFVIQLRTGLIELQSGSQLTDPLQQLNSSCHGDTPDGEGHTRNDSGPDGKSALVRHANASTSSSL